VIRTQIIAENLVFPECPRWHDGKLWFSDIHDYWVKTCTDEGNVQNVVSLGESVQCTGLGFLPNGQLLIVSPAASKLMCFGLRGLIEYADIAHLTQHRCNDMVVDSIGRAYVGHHGFNLRAPNPIPAMADLILVNPDRSSRVVASGLGFPNGPIISEDGRTLIVAESLAARFSAFDIAMDGSLVNRRTWAQFDDLGLSFSKDDPIRVSPDGSCLDTEGAIWAASPGLDEVLRIREGGEVTHRVKPSQAPFACVLGGADRKTLFICTARTYRFPEVHEVRSGRIETCRVEIAGAGIP
jgi:sugar lactone lactonase YvrE